MTPDRDRRPATGDRRLAVLLVLLALGALSALLASGVLSALLAPSALWAQSGERDRAESQARRANERLAGLQREAEQLAAQQRTLLVELRRLEVDRDLKTEQVRQIEADTRQVARELGNTSNQIDALEAQETASLPLLNARMVELYKLGSGGYVRLLFNVQNLKELGRAYRMVSALAAVDRQRAISYRENLQALRVARGSLERRRAEIARLGQQAQGARAAAEDAALSHRQRIADIDTRRDLTAELAAELQNAQQRLQQTLGALNSGTPRAAGDAPPLPIRPFRGDLEWPVAGRVMTRFRGVGNRVVTVAGQSGVQLAVEEGTPVKAVHDGTVAFAGPFTGYGNLVIVDHGSDTFSLYGQLGGTDVERGAKIERGRVIGTAGRVLAGIPGIYFEMRVDGKAADPLEWLKKTP